MKSLGKKNGLHPIFICEIKSVQLLFSRRVESGVFSKSQGSANSSLECFLKAENGNVVNGHPWGVGSSVLLQKMHANTCAVPWYPFI